MKGLRVTKSFKEIKFERVWGELKSKTGFQRQSFTKYLRISLVFTRNSTLREKFNFYFARVLLGLTKYSFWQEDFTLEYYSMKFRHFPDIS